MTTCVEANGAFEAEATQASQISDVSKTLLIPVWARAVETQRKDGIIQDPYAGRIVSEYDHDFSSYGKANWKSQLGIAIRTRHFDRAVAQFLTTHPRGVIVNLGCGFDARSYRMDNGMALWFDLDFPEVLEHRNRFFDEDCRHVMLGYSALDDDWYQKIPRDLPLLILAEGLFMYFSEHDMKTLIQSFATEFPDAELVFDTVGTMLVNRSKIHDTLSKCKNVEFTWGLDDATEVCRWSKKIKVLEVRNLFETQHARWNVWTLLSLIPKIRKSTQVFRYRIAH
ncbi:MAG: class I SAM-dependent methyltransferase [Desulfovibrionales bacterium]|nr:class I SAM-dependent methyltransferase [Desulfovibrionales bacterium]